MAIQKKNRWFNIEENDFGKEETLNAKQAIKDCIVILLFFCVGVPAFFGSFYTVPEGHVGIVKRFSAAVKQENPGLHLKVPFVDSVEEMEVRTRKNTENANAATSEQMPISSVVSINWTVTKSAAMDLFVSYGGLDQFEQRMLDPKLRQAAKATLSKFSAEQLIQNREQARSNMQEMFTLLVKDLPISDDSAQIEDVKLPQKYLKSIEQKQTEKNLAAAEEHKLARQKLEAQQKVQTAEAERDAKKAEAGGIAYKIETEAQAEARSIEMKGLAEAEAIKAKSKALKNNPLIVQLTHEQQWNGQLPTTVMGGDQNVLWNMKK